MSLVRDTQYRCTSTYCYGIASGDIAALKQLQSTLNSAIKAFGAGSTLTVDGKVGSGTVTAVKNLAALLRTKVLSGIATTPMDPKEYVTKLAPEIGAELTAALYSKAAGANPVAAASSAPRVTGTSDITTPSLSTAFDSVAAAIRNAASTSHNVIPSPTNTTPAIPGVTYGQSQTPDASVVVSATGPVAPLPTWAKITLGVLGLGIVGLGAYMLSTSKKA